MNIGQRTMDRIIWNNPKKRTIISESKRFWRDYDWADYNGEVKEQ